MPSSMSRRLSSLVSLAVGASFIHVGCSSATESELLASYTSSADNDASVPDGAPASLQSDGGSELDSASAGPESDAASIGPACAVGHKACGGSCVDVNDPKYGCSANSCGPCSADVNATFTCASGSCQVVACATGYKNCGNKCVATTDPTFGCGPTACSSTACPALVDGVGALVCQGDSCVIAGACGAGTKKCGNKCVPADRNNGCADGSSCGSCTSSEVCSGSPSKCTCVADNASACLGRVCGTVKNNCGADVSCGTCAAPTTCGGGGVVGQCACAPDPIATTCAGKACGPATNNCGEQVWCPSTCSELKTCDATSNACIDPPSCVGLGAGQATCGNAGESCCRNSPVTGGTFYRNNSQPSYAATISDFRLDRYEVTVKRYQAFKYAWVSQGYRPAAGAGKHRHIPGGLNGNEVGWEQAWVNDTAMHITSSDFDSFFACGPKATWGSATGDLAMNCVSWWEAYAFCIWDGGFLPSATELNYAAAGGAEQRVYPWGSYWGGSTHANVCTSGGHCADSNVTRVGLEYSGAGKWGQIGLLGNVAELSADRPASAVFSPIYPCTNCSDVTSPVHRTALGASFGDWYGNVSTASATFVTSRSERVGFRCARLP